MDSKAREVQPFPTSLQGVPIPSSGSSYGGSNQASFAPEQDYSPENSPYSDQTQSMFFQENSNGGQGQEVNYPDEPGQFSQMNFGTGAEGYDGIRSATYQDENDRGNNRFEGRILTSDSNVF